MTTAGDIRDRIKSDLTLSGTDYDAQILSAVQSALRQLRGAQYWFLSAYGTVTTTATSETVDITSTLADFSSLLSADITANGRRYTDGDGFDLFTFEKLRKTYWVNDPIPSGRPYAWALDGDTLYLSHKADAAYTISLRYFKQDASLPGVNDGSVWFDDGQDLVRAMAQYIFKRDAQGMLLQEADGDMVAMAKAALDKTHETKIIGSGY